jgi:hypothetical protein
MQLKCPGQNNLITLAADPSRLAAKPLAQSHHAHEQPADTQLDFCDDDPVFDDVA